MLKPFEVPKKDADVAINEAEQHLLELAEGLEEEEAELHVTDESTMPQENEGIPGGRDINKLISEFDIVTEEE
jgi:hypothetical protein